MTLRINLERTSAVNYNLLMPHVDNKFHARTSLSLNLRTGISNDLLFVIVTEISRGVVNLHLVLVFLLSQKISQWKISCGISPLSQKISPLSQKMILLFVIVTEISRGQVVNLHLVLVFFLRSVHLTISRFCCCFRAFFTNI